ncbi:phage major tail tube protein [Sphingobium sp. 15-1]|uniref:phage major tail tube protein n=1 Tax=Sphingobium sp. 15-1 TaxID=2729616 RepID=UPI00159C2407|nr:phage major tail tube protein [Sphingobium sp. 15-1]
MGLPSILKNMMLFNEGQNYMGEVKTVTLPPLTRKIEEWRGGGMPGAIGIDMGMDGLLEMASTFGGPMRDILRQFGVLLVNGVYLRWVGFHQKDDTGATDTVEVIVRGRHNEVDMGDQEVGEVGEFKVTTTLAYFKLVWNGRTEIEYDPLNAVFIVNGVDLMAEQRSGLGLF